MTNIFLIDPRLGPEDRLTYSWTYVLNTIPGLGQRFVDYLVRECGLESTTFGVAIDHPRGTARDRPDFLLRCQHWDVLFEHKLDAGLGVSQLERYLEFAENRGRTRLGFVAPESHPVSEEVVRHAKYIRPRLKPHFLWQELYPLVEMSPDLIARHFCEYLTSLGVQPWCWGSIGDPLTAPSAEEALRNVFAGVAGKLRSLGHRCVVSKKAFAIELRSPLPNIHLAYLKARQSLEEYDFRVPGRVLILKIWINRSAGAPGLEPAFGYLRDSSPRIYVSQGGGVARWDKRLTAERLYSVSLDEILGDAPEVAEDNITEFVKACLVDLAGHGRLQRQQSGETR